DGADYARQLDALGAILAVPEEDGEYRVFRDLKKRPVEGKIEDLSKIDRIFWVDDRAMSVGPLGKALGLKADPARVIAFFPERFEKDLYEKELKFKNRKESENAETRFRIIRKGKDYSVVVESQREATAD